MASAAELAVFEDFGKMTRWEKVLVTVTEKIDGTNAQICISPDGKFQVGSRNRWITPGKDTDNYGFAAWAYENEEMLRGLGIGRHFGEWWGYGIGRGYGCSEGERYFSLFESYKWVVQHRLTCCKVVPILFHGQLGDLNTDAVMAKLWAEGSVARPGYKFPEGVIMKVNGTNFKMPYEKRHKWQLEGENEGPVVGLGKVKEALSEVELRRKNLRSEWHKAKNSGTEGALESLHGFYSVPMTTSANDFAMAVAP